MATGSQNYVHLADLDNPTFEEVLKANANIDFNVGTDEIESVAQSLAGTGNEESRKLVTYLQTLLRTDMHRIAMADCRRYREARVDDSGHPKMSNLSTIRYSARAETIIRILSLISQERKITKDNTIVLPFGGIGSLAGFLNGLGLNVLSNDLLANRSKSHFYDVEYNVNQFRTNVSEKIGLSMAWGETTSRGENALDLFSELQDVEIMICTPPFGFDCRIGIETSACDHTIEYMGKSSTSLSKSGTAYYYIPAEWLPIIFSAPSLKRLNLRVISKKLLNYHDSRFPVCLLAVEKKENPT